MRRGSETTPEGAALAAVLRTAFDQIEAQTRRPRARPVETTLRIKLPPTFAIRWFVPRLARLHPLTRPPNAPITPSHPTFAFDRLDLNLSLPLGTAQPPAPSGGRLC